jgi:hypothetical protein
VNTVTKLRAEKNGKFPGQLNSCLLFKELLYRESGLVENLY